MLPPGRERLGNPRFSHSFLHVKTSVFPTPFLFESCAPARIRTWNNASEERCDIHFTTGAMGAIIPCIRANTTIRVQYASWKLLTSVSPRRRGRHAKRSKKQVLRR